MNLNESKSGTPAPLAKRLGQTYHVSPLLMRVRRLMKEYPSGADCPTGWLLDVGNARGARIVNRVGKLDASFVPPSLDELSNEELIAALCQMQLPEQLQALRVAAQLISAGGLDRNRLKELMVRERLQYVLGSLAREARHVEPDHPEWLWISEVCGGQPPKVTLLHWTRLAMPIPGHRHVASGKWKLVA